MHVRHLQTYGSDTRQCPLLPPRNPRPHWSSQTWRASQLISLSDLENDFINPHDASAQINAWVVRYDPNLPSRNDLHVAVDALLAFISHAR